MRLETGKKYVGQVVAIESYGAVLKFEDESTHLLHISHISDKFITDITEFINVGDTLEVYALPGKVKPIELTIRESEITNYFSDDRSFGDLLEEYLPNEKDIWYKDRYSNSKQKGRKRSNSHNKRK